MDFRVPSAAVSLAPWRTQRNSRSRNRSAFEVLNRRQGEPYSYDEIKDQLMVYLQNQKLQEAYDEWLTGIRDSAYVEIKAWEK